MHQESHQKIDCTVCSCQYNDQGKRCRLDCICVEPCADCHSGKKADESMCGSYKAR